MPILGYHFVKGAYGQWMPGDERGHWSKRWDAERGLVDRGRLVEGDPRRRRLAENLRRFEPTLITPEIEKSIEAALVDCVARSRGGLIIAAGAIEATHIHLLIVAGKREIDVTAKWIADQTAKAVNRLVRRPSKLWAAKKWICEIEESKHWDEVARYIEDHNQRRGMGRRPFVDPDYQR